MIGYSNICLSIALYIWIFILMSKLLNHFSLVLWALAICNLCIKWTLRPVLPMVRTRILGLGEKGIGTLSTWMGACFVFYIDISWNLLFVGIFHSF